MNRIESEYQKRSRLRDTQIDRTQIKMAPETSQRLTPIVDRFDKACFEDELARAGPFYLRQLPIFPKGTPGFLVPDYTKDPRYGLPTKSPSIGYMTIDRI